MVHDIAVAVLADMTIVQSRFFFFFRSIGLPQIHTPFPKRFHFRTFQDQASLDFFLNSIVMKSFPVRGSSFIMMFRFHVRQPGEGMGVRERYRADILRVAHIVRRIVEYRPMESFTSFQVILQGVARRQGFDMRLWEHRLQTRWKDVVGEVLAAHTYPSRIRFRKLSITVENSVWLHQLTFLKDTLLAKIHAEVGEHLLTDVTFRVGDIPTQPTSQTREASVSHDVSADAMMAATKCSHVIADQELRNALTRVIAKAFSAG